MQGEGPWAGAELRDAKGEVTGWRTHLLDDVPEPGAAAGGRGGPAEHHVGLVHLRGVHAGRLPRNSDVTYSRTVYTPVHLAVVQGPGC